MKSHLVSHRKQARILATPQTIQQAAQEAEGLIAIMESTGDARLQQMQQVAKWLKNVASNAAMQNQLDDQAYPQFAQQAEKYVRWVSQMSNLPQFQTHGIEQTEMPPVASQTAAKKRGAGSAGENWVTDRNEKAEAKEPVKAEVPRVAAKKVAQPGALAPAAAPAAPAAAGAPAAAPAPPPPAPLVTKPGNGNISADIKQMSSESLSNIVTAISKGLDPNDKAAWDFVQSLSGELKTRPVEVEQGAARSASVKTALGLYDDTPVGAEVPGEEMEEEPMGTGPGKCPQCYSATINGTYCHERGCPNERKVWDPEVGDWVRESECPECGGKLREGETCNCMEPMNEEPTDMQHFCFGGLNTASVDKQSAEDAKFERCVHHVKEQNKEEGGSEKKPYNPWAVCHQSVGSKSGSIKVAVTPPGISEETAHDIKKEYPGEKDKAYATMWAIHNKQKESSVSPHEVAYQAYREGKLSTADWTKIQAAQAEIVNTITAAGDAGGWFIHDEETGDVTESGGATPEVEEAHKLEDEAPAKLDRPETTEPIKLNDNPLNSKSATEKKRDASTALKKVKSLADKLQSIYLDAKEITQVNDSRMVREAVEAIFLAYDLLGQAAKVLGKQEMQEKAEEEAVKVKEKSKKSSILGDLILAAEEEERCESCGKELSGSESELCHQCAKKQRKGEGPKKPSKKDW